MDKIYLNCEYLDAGPYGMCCEAFKHSRVTCGVFSESMGEIAEYPPECKYKPSFYIKPVDDASKLSKSYVWVNQAKKAEAEEREKIYAEHVAKGKGGEWVKDNVDRDGNPMLFFESGAIREDKVQKGRCDLLPMCAVIRLSKHFQDSLLDHPERNWEKGIPMHSFIDSALRHLMEYADGKKDEDHLARAAWNVMCAMWTEEKKPEMQDIPAILAEKEL